MGMDGGPDPQFLHGRKTRFRYDNGTETDSGVPAVGGGAGWIANRNADIIMPINHHQFRFRWGMSNEDGAEAGRTQQLQVSHEGAAFALVRDTSQHVVTIHTENFDHNDDATDYGEALQDLHTAAFADTTNGYLVSLPGGDITGPAGFPAAARRMESEWSIALVPSDLAVGEEIHFRGFSTGAAYADGYDNTPKITIAAAAGNPEAWFIKRNHAIISRIVGR